MKWPNNKPIGNPDAVRPGTPLPKEKTEEEWRTQMVHGWTTGKPGVLPVEYRGYLDSITAGSTSEEVTTMALELLKAHRTADAYNVAFDVHPEETHPLDAANAV